ncbi:hypothetical protein RF55_23009 [Lasius niger]|uniref:Uncharacterized protein n=1 Tax=Lasius niger TaxID=67767 RepID=A0A0J7JW20_LASNI|nr:hypothetical protein RF55_23009 [Lasius niger]
MNLLVELEKNKFEDIRKNKELDEMRHMVKTLRKEVLELRDKLDEVELDRQKERERWRLEKSKLKREVATSLKENDSKNVVNLERNADAAQGTGSISHIVNKKLDLTSMKTHPEHQSDIVELRQKPEVMNPVSSRLLEPKSNREKEVKSKLAEVNKQINELFKVRTELRKKEDYSDTGGPRIDPQRNKEAPLPQRTPRIKPKVISSVQIAPPSFEEKRSGRNLNQAGTKLSEKVWTNVRRRGGAKTKQVGFGSLYPSSGKEAKYRI